jgi:hypothetical protein
MSFNEVWQQLTTLLVDDTTLQDSSHLNESDLSDYVSNGFSQVETPAKGIAFLEVSRGVTDEVNNLEDILVDIQVWGPNFEAVADRVYALLCPRLGNPFNLGTNGAAQPSDRTISVVPAGSGPLFRLDGQRALGRTDSYIFKIGR